MSELRLTPSSSLKSIDLSAIRRRDETGSVSIAERSGVSICSMFARKGTEAQLVHRVRDVFGAELPRKPSYCRQGPVAFVWAGRSQWLVLQDSNARDSLEQRLRSSLTETASIINQSDGRAIVRVCGSRARNALAKGLLIDLHPSSFQPGDAAITSIAYIGVNFWQIDAVPTYDFAIFRSFAVAFWEWLVEAAAEFDVVIESPK